MSLKPAWIFTGPEDLDNLDPKQHYGFVYRITNKQTGKKYIGKKFFWFKKIKTVKKKKKRYLAESDWKEYWGSSESLLKDIAAFGHSAFEREIIRICATKSECAYCELREQMIENAILSEEYYNDWVSGKITRRHMQKIKSRLGF